MTKVTYGAMENWEDIEASSGGGADFMTLKEGDNVVRIFTAPHQYVVHWVKDQTGQNKRVKCALEDCPLCKNGEKQSTRWYIGVIDRADGNTKILEISTQIMSGLKAYATNPQWGPPKGYDIVIKRGPKGSNPLYHVMANPKTKVEKEEKEKAKKFLENTDLAKMCIPATLEEISEKMGWSAPAQQTFNAPSPQPAASKKPEPTTEVSDEDFSFDDEDDGDFEI